MRLSTRASAVAAVAVALLLVGSATAYGSWARTRPVDSNATVTSGTIGLSSAWATPLVTTSMWPGQSRTGVLRLTHSGNGRWNYAVAVAASGALAPSTTVALTGATGPAAADCGTGVITPGAWSGTPLATGASVYVCVTVTLPATAPSTVQGAALTVAVTGTARNQPTY